MNLFRVLKRQKRPQPSKQKIARMPRKERHRAWKEQKREERELSVTIKRRRQLEDMETKRMKREKERSQTRRKGQRTKD
ncbi:MAG: hypothetical protein PHG80_11960 [Methanoregulaceae archaeon]|nr:hypothetical protein [Methanoregulaceae archaeon]